MKERPILFNSEMVLSILDGHKTQTRRPVKRQPPSANYQLGLLVDTTNSDDRKHRGKFSWTHVEENRVIDSDDVYFACPFGAVGDKLWVRETFADINDREFLLYKATDEPTFNKACETLGEKLIWTPSIHMPRWASRITLEITNIRVERLQEITEADAKAEGLLEWRKTDSRHISQCVRYGRGVADVWEKDPRKAFARIWNEIYGKTYSWESNAYVWAVTFKVIEDK